MAKVQVSDIVVPDVFNPYFLERTAEKSRLIRSGIVMPDPELNRLAVGGGRLINMPFYTDLSGDDQILSDVSPLDTRNIGTAQDLARLHLRGDARSVNDLSGALSGTDPLSIIVDLISEFWARKEQALLIATLGGVFADNLLAISGDTGGDGDLIHNHAAEATADVKIWSDTSPTVMCPEAIIDTQALLGDSTNEFTAIMMHSKCLTDLKKQELIDTERPSGAGSEIYYYMGKEVIIDDTCPTRAGTGVEPSTIYQSFLFAKGAIGRGEGAAPVPSEFERSALNSDTYFVTRRHFIMHPRGIRWMENACDGQAPTNAESLLAENWNRVYEKKNLRLAMIETN